MLWDTGSEGGLVFVGLDEKKSHKYEMETSWVVKVSLDEVIVRSWARK